MGMPPSSSAAGIDPAAAAQALAGAFGQQQQQQQEEMETGPSLADVLKPEIIVPLLNSPDMVERLAPYLPEDHRHGVFNATAAVQLSTAGFLPPVTPAFVWLEAVIDRQMRPARRNQEALVALAQSSQFRQQLQTFGQALQSGMLNLAHFGLNAEVSPPCSICSRSSCSVTACR